MMCKQLTMYLGPSNMYTIWKTNTNKLNEKNCSWEFPGGLVVKTQHFRCCGPGFHPCGRGTNIPQATCSVAKAKTNKQNK